MEININSGEQFWNDFEKYLKHNNRFFIPNEIRQILDDIIIDETFNETILSNEILYRGRKGRHLCIDNMGAPKEEKSNAGRCNPTGIPYLYLSRDIGPCISELKPNIGEDLTIGSFKINKDLSIFSLIDNVYVGDEFKVDLSLFLNFNFSKFVTVDKELNYIPTQFFSELVKNNGFDGIEYSSSVYKTGKNIVLFDTNSASCFKTELYRINNINYEYEKGM
jgi:hypothetical protein